VDIAGRQVADFGAVQGFTVAEGTGYFLENGTLLRDTPAAQTPLATGVSSFGIADSGTSVYVLQNYGPSNVGNDCGTLVKLSAAGAVQWTLARVHSFCVGLDDHTIYVGIAQEGNGSSGDAEYAFGVYKIDHTESPQSYWGGEPVGVIVTPVVPSGPLPVLEDAIGHQVDNYVLAEGGQQIYTTENVDFVQGNWVADVFLYQQSQRTLLAHGAVVGNFNPPLSNPNTIIIPIDINLNNQTITFGWVTLPYNSSPSSADDGGYSGSSSDG
jgi:hypothetical protein